MKNTWIRKLCIAAVLCLVTTGLIGAALADSGAGDLLRFIPTTIVVEEKSVQVKGYFVNMNDGVDIKNMTDFKMDVYLDGDLLVDGSFGKINEFTVKAMGVKYQGFTFNGEHDLNVGEYTCGDKYYCVIECSFTSVR